jgi:hypothetical protein
MGYIYESIHGDTGEVREEMRRWWEGRRESGAKRYT